MSGRILYLRIYDWVDEYESRGFQNRLNGEAKKYLRQQGIDVIILPAPQGTGAIGSSVGTIIKILSFISKIAVFVVRHINSHFDIIADQEVRHLTILLQSTITVDIHSPIPVNAGNLSKRLVSIGYDLKQHLEKEYTGYLFKIETSIQGDATDYSLSVHVDNSRPKKSDIGKIFKNISKLTVKAGVVEHVTLSDKFLVEHLVYNKNRDKLRTFHRLPYFALKDRRENTE